MKAEFLQKAAVNLNVARYCYEQSYYGAAVNRAYYASFQAAIAALADRSFTSSKNDHKWVQASFNGELIKRRKIYPSHLKSYLGDMLSFRNLSDYSTINLSKRVAHEQLAHAEELVAIIRKELEHS